MLKICTDLFDELNSNKIMYCHWKSNEHLVEGLNGETDLDILIDKCNYFKVVDILNKYKFKRYNTISYLKYSAIEDYIGYDIESGKMIHIHLHYELTLGRKFIKEYHLPFENYIYENLIYDNKNNIYLIDRNIEMILLIIRFIMKNGRKKVKNNKILNNEFIVEFLWLLDKIQYDKLEEHSKILINEEFALSIVKYIKDYNNAKYFVDLRNITLNHIKRYKTSNYIISQFKFLLYKLIAGINFIKAKKMHLPTIYRRGIPEGGKIIVFIGVDGSGKSTFMKEIESWLKWKLDVCTFYFGSGDGKSSMLRMPLVKVTKIIKKNKPMNNNNDTYNEVVSNKTKKMSIYKVYKILWAITLAYEKKKKLQSIWKAKSKGLYIICDRYPQSDILGYNDGPLLYKWLSDRNIIKRNLSKWEYNIYKLASDITPDIVIRLNVSDEIAFKRKPDTPIKMIRKKIEAVNSIKFNSNTLVYDINTEGEVKTSLNKIKKIVWGI